MLNPMSKGTARSRRIYITHCSAKKDNSLRGTALEVRPCGLYTAAPTRRFMERCKEHGVRWAIFSDHYGIWFSNEERKWYGDDVGDPNRVSEEKFRELVRNFDRKLAHYDEIYFYYNPGRFHPLYKLLLKETRLKGRIVRITHLWDIV